MAVARLAHPPLSEGGVYREVEVARLAHPPSEWVRGGGGV